MKKYAPWIFGAAIGGILGLTEINVQTWQFWAVIVLVGVFGGVMSK